MRRFPHGKIHKATVTPADLNYVGNITTDEDPCEKAGFGEGEKVLIVSTTSGSRLETYIIDGVRGAGIICPARPPISSKKAGKSSSWGSN